MLQPKGKFNVEVFKNPTKEYRGAPFWGWNGKLDKQILAEQIDVLKEMGFGGFHIHSRIGLATEYLGEEFMDCVKFCNEYAKSKDMLCWLYDEDKWPSGYGGGMVTENPEFAARYLLFSPNYLEGHYDCGHPMRCRLTDSGEAVLRAKYHVQLENGKLVSYRRLDTEKESEPDMHEVNSGEVWYAYEVIGDKLPWFNNQAYVDVLNPKAIQYFVEKVYEKYKQVLGEDFSKNVPAIFTDEPQYINVQLLPEGSAKCDAGISYTSNMDEEFKDRKGYSILDKLPEIFWNRADGQMSRVRYDYFDFITERFAESYAGVLGKWCEENNIMLTGHMMYEGSLAHDAMRCYPHFQLPGIDMLGHFYEYNTAKQPVSVVHQEGKPGIMSELYGVTNWDLDFRGHKVKGDWQAAAGVTVRVPHLAWMSMGGESKRDYPAPIDAHSPWYRQYKVVEDHFARLNTVLRRGKADIRVGVIHPNQSYWMLMGPTKDNAVKKKAMDMEFNELTQWLMFNFIDFDFIFEGLIPKQKIWVEDGKLHVGDMAYETVIVPRLVTMKRITLELLCQFREQGGKVIMIGEPPAYIDAEPSQDARVLGDAVCTGFDQYRILEELEENRLVDVKTTNGIRPSCLICQMRQDDDCKWLFVAHGKEEIRNEASNFIIYGETVLEFSVKDTWQVELFDTMTGEISQIYPEYKEGKTFFQFPCCEQDSFLFRLTEGRSQEEESSDEGCEDKKTVSSMFLKEPCTYTLEEPNCLLMDTAWWRLDGEPWQEPEEMLKLDNQIRRKCGYRLRTDAFPQPWLSQGKNDKEHMVKLRFIVDSDIFLPNVEFAFEGDEDVKIFWNGKEVFWKNSEEWFIDRAIHRITLGQLAAGQNELVMKVPFGVNTNLEWCYLLGEFGVQVSGARCKIVQKPDRVSFGDYSRQGFSFYGGNFVYELEIFTEAGKAQIEIPHYSAAALGVSLDGGEEKVLFMSPYVLNLGEVSQGKHSLKIRSFGNRINQFGQLHNCNAAERYFGPRTWRTEGAKWCYEYNLRKCGVLAAPILKILQ